MHCVKLLINESEGGNPCFSILPEEIGRPNIRSEVIQCTCLAEDGGGSIIRITDPDGHLSEKVGEHAYFRTGGGECMIDRISSHQMIAMVMNNNCRLSRILSESGCFMTSATAEGDGDICWTVVGPNSAYVNNLIARLQSEGFGVRRRSSFSTDYAALLSERQEEALRVALENGFYEIPRKIRMDELAGMLGCSKSTLDVTLRNAERKVITHYVLQNRDAVINRKR